MATKLKDWREALRHEAQVHDTFDSMPSPVYAEFVGLNEWINTLDDEAFRIFCLLVAEAA